jgi:hypothetical protein
LEDSYEYIEYGVADSQKEMILQLGSHIVLKNLQVLFSSSVTISFSRRT